jgi:type I restriction enzyme S subunit
VYRLDEVAEVGSGVTLGRDLEGSPTVELPYLRVENVQDGFLDLAEIKTVRIRPNEVERFSLQPKDVLMTEGGDIDKLGRGAIWTGEITPCLHQNHIFRVRTNAAILVPEFLAALIASDYGKRYFIRIAKRTTNLASINKTQLRAFPVPCPPLEVQCATTAVLAATDTVIQRTRAEVAVLEKLKRGLIQDLLTERAQVNLPARGGNGAVRSRT